VNMGIRLYNKMSDHIRKLEKNKLFKRELKSFLLQHAFYSLDEFYHTDCMCIVCEPSKLFVSICFV
jgi:hypothetical protein